MPPARLPEVLQLCRLLQMGLWVWKSLASSKIRVAIGELFHALVPLDKM